MDNKNEHTPTEEPVNNETDTAEPNIVTTPQQRMNSIYPTAQSSAASQEPLDNRNRIAPSSIVLDANSIDAPVKKSSPVLGFIIVAAMLVIIVILSFLNFKSISNFVAGYTGGSYIDIEKTCPVLKNNISKISIFNKRGRSLIITNNGDLYYLFNATDNDNKLGSCKKISGVSNVQDIAVFSFEVAALRLKDESVGMYIIQLNNGSYDATLTRTETDYASYQDMSLTAAIYSHLNKVVNKNIKIILLLILMCTLLIEIIMCIVTALILIRL